MKMEKITQSDAEEKRREHRAPLLTHVQLSRGGNVLGMARTLDLSPSGFAGSTSVKLTVGQSIGIGINGIGTVPAVVVRQERSRFAVRFEEPIDLRDVDVSPIIAPHKIVRKRSSEGMWT